VLAWLVVVAIPAHADPEADFAACKARRRQLTREAMKISDMIERGRALALMPICRRFGDNSVEVVGPLPPPPKLQPMPLRAEAAVTVGYGAWKGFSLASVTSAPFLELEAGARVRGLSVVGFAGYAQAQRSAARDSFADGGVKVRFHEGPLAAGLGAGVEQVHDAAAGTTHPRDDMHELGLVEGDLGYTAVARDQFSVRLLAIASGALDGGSSSVWSARIALSVGR